MRANIGWNHTEVLTVLFNLPVTFAVVGLKYSFGFNFNVDKSKTYRIRWYIPGTYVSFTQMINGVVYGVPDLHEYVTVTIAKRGGGYYCIDKPLSSFMIDTNGATGHYELELADWEIDTTNSYLKFTQTGFGGTYLINLHCDLRPQ